MTDDNRRKDYLIQFVRSSDLIFMDTCSLIYNEGKGVDAFWIHVRPILRDYKKRIIITVSVRNELIKLKNKYKEKQIADKAYSCLNELVQLGKEGLIDIVGDESDGCFADKIFMSKFIDLRTDHRLMLITQDNNLAKEILRYNQSYAVKGESISVKRIDFDGYLENFSWKGFDRKNALRVPEHEKFLLCSKVTSIPDTEMHSSLDMPVEGGEVYTDQGGNIRLMDQIGNGGEGIIYNTNTDYVAKIYKKGKLTRRKYEKLRLILEKNLKVPKGICFPVSALYNQKKEFIGVLMQKAKGETLYNCAFSKSKLSRHFPKWKKREMVQLCVTILEKIVYLHERNIIIGDIKDDNILVVSPKEVYFVDTDSYQIADFPCPVGTERFTAPEIQNKISENFLRSFGNENFAVATLLFQIMLPGKLPYAQQDGESVQENIRNMQFPYPLGSKSTGTAPEGPWRFIWSHLPRKLMKESFYETFMRNGQHSSENTRFSSKDWLMKFEKYLGELNINKYNDTMSYELFPDRFKYSNQVEYVLCSICGEKMPDYDCRRGHRICRKCLKKGEIYKCDNCGKKLIFTYQEQIENPNRPPYCNDCMDHVYETCICVKCHKPYDITYKEKAWYDSKSWKLPTHCIDCRKNKGNTFNNGRTEYEEPKNKDSSVSDLIRRFFVG